MAEIIGIVISIIAFLMSIFTFVYNAYFAKVKLFVDIHAIYMGNDNARKACREVKEHLCEIHMANTEEGPLFEVWMDQFLFYINLLLGISNKRGLKKLRKQYIQYELDAIANNELVVNAIFDKRNHLYYIRQYLEDNYGQKRKRR